MTQGVTAIPPTVHRTGLRDSLLHVQSIALQTLSGAPIAQSNLLNESAATVLSGPANTNETGGSLVRQERDITECSMSEIACIQRVLKKGRTISSIAAETMPVAARTSFAGALALNPVTATVILATAHSPVA